MSQVNKLISKSHNMGCGVYSGEKTELVVIFVMSLANKLIMKLTEVSFKKSCDVLDKHALHQNYGNDLEIR